MTKPAPSHSPWSGGSNRALKLVTSLSRLLVPSKLDSSALGSVGWAALDFAAETLGETAVVPVVAAERAPRERVEATLGPAALAAVRPGWTPVATRLASAGVPVWVVTAGAAAGLAACADNAPRLVSPRAAARRRAVRGMTG